MRVSNCFEREFGAGNEIRTRDPNLGKVVLYQLSYSRLRYYQFIPAPRLMTIVLTFLPEIPGSSGVP